MSCLHGAGLPGGRGRLKARRNRRLTRLGRITPKLETRAPGARLEQEGQTGHGHEVVNPTADLGTAIRLDDPRGELCEVVANFYAQQSAEGAELWRSDGTAPGMGSIAMARSVDVPLTIDDFQKGLNVLDLIVESDREKASMNMKEILQGRKFPGNIYGKKKRWIYLPCSNFYQCH